MFGQAGGSPLSSCLMDESSRDVLKSAGADGWTPLLQAAEHADLAAVKELLLNRANVKARTKVIFSYSRAAACILVSGLQQLVTLF